MITFRGWSINDQNLNLTVTSVILPDVTEGLVEQILIFDLILDVYHLAQGLLDLPFAGLSVLPTGKPDQTHDFVDVIDDPLYHYRRLAILHLDEQFGQGGFRLGLFINRVHPLFRLNDLLRQRQQLLEEIEAVEQPLLVSS